MKSQSEMAGSGKQLCFTANKADKSLSRENTNCLKGILAICILLCHLWGYLSSGDVTLTNNIAIRMLGRCFTVFGYLSVAVFLFLSGYGLVAQYMKKGAQYLNGFLKRRVLPLAFIYLLLVFFYWGMRVLLGENVPTLLLVKSFLLGGTVIANGWYLQVILIFYILFYLCFKFINNEKLKFTFFILCCFLYIGVCLTMKLESTWYESSLCLVLGVVWARYADKINNILLQPKQFVVCLVLSWIFFFGTLALGNFGFFEDYIRIPIKCISAFVFVVAVITLLRILPINNVITRFLGKISLELYVMHGLILMLFRSKYVYVSNVWLYSLLVITCSVILACCVHPLFSKILTFGQRKINHGNEN